MAIGAIVAEIGKRLKISIFSILVIAMAICVIANQTFNISG
jgi:hypothetical protein